VLAAFALPGTLGLGGKPGVDFGNAHAGVERFTSVHAKAMWLVIPPLIAAMFASYTMFAFVAMLHLLDIMNVKKNLEECLRVLGSFYSAGALSQTFSSARMDVVARRSDATHHSNEVSECSVSKMSQSPFSSMPQPGEDGSITVENLQAQLRKDAMEERLFKTVCELIVSLFRGAQLRINHTCKAVGNLWIHLVFFSTCQVLAISNAFKMHANGTLKMQYTWWWCLQDVFHLGGGVILLAAAMGVFCVVTSYFRFVRTHAWELLVQVGCPPARQASVMGLLAVQPLGMRVLFGSVYIDVPKAAGFFFVILTAVLNNSIELLNSIDYS